MWKEIKFSFWPFDNMKTFWRNDCTFFLFLNFGIFQAEKWLKRNIKFCWKWERKTILKSVSKFFWQNTRCSSRFVENEIIRDWVSWKWSNFLGLSGTPIKMRKIERSEFLFFEQFIDFWSFLMFVKINCKQLSYQMMHFILEMREIISSFNCSFQIFIDWIMTIYKN